MARIRSIKPEFFTNDEMAELPPLTRLLFVGLWTQADREGRLEYRPRRLKAALLPYDDCDIEAMLDSLSESGQIVIYVAENKRYIAVVNFARHQHPHIKEAESEIPPPTCENVPAPCENGASTILARRKGREGKGVNTCSKAASDGDFDTFWQAYPRRVGKKAALKAYAKAVKEATPESILAAVHAADFDTRENGRFIPHPSTWLNQGRYMDEPAERKPTAGEIADDRRWK